MKKIICLTMVTSLLTVMAYAQGNETFYRTLTGYQSDRGTTITQGLGGTFNVRQSPTRPNSGYTAPINPYGESRQNKQAGTQFSVVDWTR